MRSDNVEAEHEKLAMDPRRAPRRVFRRHTPDQATDFSFRRGASDEPATRLPGPELPKALSVPPHDGVGLDDDQVLLPPWPEAAKRDPEEPIRQTHPRSRSLGLADGELLAKGEVLDQKVRSRRSKTSEPTQDDGDSGEHRATMKACGSVVNDVADPDWR